ncbi:MAG: LysR family transcriptional regulator, partial [Chitinivibrionales bacterium]|nr:LysR family transcriptional regulator [Chitinivibrionales bacterium]
IFMNIENLRSFCMIVQEGSISRAARRLFLTQPALSMQLKLLEEHFGEALVYRSKKQITCTEAGRIVHERSELIFRQLEAIKHEIYALKNLVAGTLIISCSDTVSTFLLPQPLAEFARRYPALDITVHNRQTSAIVAQLLQQEIEIGFVTLPVDNPMLVISQFRHYHDVAVCSPHYPLAEKKNVTIQELAHQRLLLLEPGTQSRGLLDRDFARAGVALHSAMEFGSVAVQKAFALHGLGVAIVPEFAVVQECKTKQLCCIPVTGFAKRQIGVAIHKNNPLSPAARAFYRFLESIKEGVTQH